MQYEEVIDQMVAEERKVTSLGRANELFVMSLNPRLRQARGIYVTTLDSWECKTDRF